MLHAVMFFHTLGVVEPVQCAHKVAGNPADTFEVDALTYELFHYSVTSCHHAPMVPGSQVQGSMSFVASQSLPSQVKYSSL